MSSTSVAVIIVNYNRRALTLRAIESVRAETDVKPRIVVIENSEMPGERIDESDGSDVVVPGDNVGFARACNIGVEHLRGDPPRAYFFLNNDAVLKPGCIRILAQPLSETPGAGIIGPLILKADGRIEAAGISLRALTGRHRLALFGRPQSDAGSFRRVRALPGTALMVSRVCFERTGGFDERLFCYFEDVDLCARASEIGIGVYIEPAAAVVHGKQGISPDEIYYSCRNHLVVLERHHPLAIGTAIRRQLVHSFYRLYVRRRSAPGDREMARAIEQALVDARAGRLGRRRLG